MAQIKIVMNTVALNMIFGDNLDVLARRLTDIVETAFGIVGKNDVAVGFFAALHTVNEAPVQIEVHYTAGGDEYNMGTIFDPNEDDQEALIEAIRTGFAAFLRNADMGSLTPSVWTRPQYQSRYRAGVVEGC